MASQHVRFTYNLQDAEGVRAPCTLYGAYDDTQTIATMLGDLATLQGYVKAVSDAQIISAEVSVITAGSTAPTNFADSDCSEVALFNFPNSAGRLWGVVVPSRADSIVTSGHVDLTTGHPAQTFTGTIEAGVGSATFTDRNWLALGALKDAFLSTRKHRRALKRASYEV